jgi:hypothetical protein
VSTTADLVALAVAGSVAGETDRVYPFGAVPGKNDPAFDYPYRVIGYAPDVPFVRNMLGGGDPRRRFTVQHFSRTSAGLEAIANTTFATFDGKPIGGDVCTQQVASTPDRDPDDRGVLSTTHVYEF